MRDGFTGRGHWTKMQEKEPFLNRGWCVCCRDIGKGVKGGKISMVKVESVPRWGVFRETAGLPSECLVVSY